MTYKRSVLTVLTGASALIFQAMPAASRDRKNQCTNVGGMARIHPLSRRLLRSATARTSNRGGSRAASSQAAMALEPGVGRGQHQAQR